jgi:ubiquinone/menaquinone biosynthesis C-methylase UbiE
MLSARLKTIVEALPLKPALRVLEIGCGPGAAARGRLYIDGGDPLREIPLR